MVVEWEVNGVRRRVWVLLGVGLLVVVVMVRERYFFLFRHVDIGSVLLVWNSL